MRILRICIPHSIERMEAEPVINNLYYIIGILGLVFFVIACAYLYSVITQPDETSILPLQSKGEPEPEPESEPKQESESEPKQESEQEQELKPKPEPNQEKKIQSARLQSESWCFVGEDLSGRYCVKVPSHKACNSDRSFYTREDCELISGSHMPGGIMQNGTNFRPLRSMHFENDTVTPSNM